MEEGKGTKKHKKAQSVRKTGKCAPSGEVGSGGRIRTDDLRVMSLAFLVTHNNSNNLKLD